MVRMSGQDLLVSGPKIPHPLSLQINGELNCMPVLMQRSLLAIPLSGGLVVVSPNGKISWTLKLPYYQNPSSLVAAGNVLIHDSGPPSIGAWDSLKDEIFASRQSVRVAANSIITGRQLWDRAWLDTGTPIVQEGSSCFFSIRPNRPSPTAWFMDKRDAATGRLLESWRLPNPTFDRKSSTQDLADVLRSSNMRWFKKGASFLGSEAMDTSILDLRTRREGARVLFSVSSHVLSFTIKSPVPRTYRIESIKKEQ